MLSIVNEEAPRAPRSGSSGRSDKPAVRAAAATEQELLQRMLAREQAAWHEFLRRYGKLINHRIHSVTKRFGQLIGEADADDIRGLFMYGLQTRDMHRLRAFDPSRSVQFGTWVGLLARHAAWDYVRAHQRMNAVLDEFDVEAVDSLADDPEQRLALQRQLQRVQERAEKMTARDRAFLHLYLQEQEPEYISRSMKVSVATVYTKKHKLQLVLRSALSERVRRRLAGGGAIGNRAARPAAAGSASGTHVAHG